MVRPGYVTHVTFLETRNFLSLHGSLTILQCSFEYFMIIISNIFIDYSRPAPA
jgi:hypothetical protein